jgi:hypothetical protein
VRKNASVATKAHIARVVALGCIVCRLRGVKDSPAEFHHPRGAAFDTGVGVKANDRDGIPLCPIHHRLGGHGLAYHAGPKEFEARFGTQQYLLEQVRALLPKTR